MKYNVNSDVSDDDFYDRVFFIYNKFSIGFYEKYSDKINWIYISRYQRMSDSFIKRFLPKLSLDNLLINRYCRNSLFLKKIQMLK